MVFPAFCRRAPADPECATTSPILQQGIAHSIGKGCDLVHNFRDHNSRRAIRAARAGDLRSARPACRTDGFRYVLIAPLSVRRGAGCVWPWVAAT
jgi:hypothetical protein